jgi:8-oxo-dGTP pyrophosphatase MutT (NUDIX family)
MNIGNKKNGIVGRRNGPSHHYPNHTDHTHDGNGAYERRRGTAIVDLPEGILVTQQGHAKFLLPGGGARPGESRLQAAVRELKEETGLDAFATLFLFQYQRSKVFLVKTTGIPQHHHEISHIDYYTKGSTIPLSVSTQKIIDQYLNLKERRIP